MWFTEATGRRKELQRSSFCPWISEELWYLPFILVLQFICYALLSTPPKISIPSFSHTKNNGYYLSSGPLIRLDLFFVKNLRSHRIRCCIGENYYYYILVITPGQPRESNSKTVLLNTPLQEVKFKIIKSEHSGELNKRPACSFQVQSSESAL